jgi:hypothetical protein
LTSVLHSPSISLLLPSSCAFSLTFTLLLQHPTPA